MVPGPLTSIQQKRLLVVAVKVFRAMYLISGKMIEM